MEYINIKHFLTVILVAIFFACSPEENNTSGNNGAAGGDNHNASVSVNADHISAVSVVLHGKANLKLPAEMDLKLGFQYSIPSSGSLPSDITTVYAEEADKDYNYSAALTKLNPNTKYQYRSFLYQNGQYTYGDTKEFTTKDLASLLETRNASGVEATKATLNAKLDLTDVQYKSVASGFLLGTSESALNTDYKCTEISDNAISAALTNLSHKTQYWFKAYVKLDRQTFYGEVKTFTTDVVPVESVSVDKTEYSFHTIDSTLTLNATVLPSDATDKSVTWTSDKEAVATVDANGRVTAKGNGKATITVTTKDHGKTASCEVTVVQWVTSISLDNTSITLNEGQEQTLIPTINPSNAADKSLNWTSSNASVATVSAEGKVTAVSKGTATIKAEAKDESGKYASCSVTVRKPLGPCPSGAVDLGLSVYWGTTNTGASKPEDYGDYYAWGETSPKDIYYWYTYKWGDGSYGTLTKYNNSSSCGTVDNKTVLEPSDDVASEKLGGKWRMPTDAEWTELRTKCTWTWVTNYNGSGINGRLVKATNGNSIFLPAADYRSATSLYGAGSSGYYWSSSLNTYFPSKAWYVLFYSDYVGVVGDRYRYYGQSVRPVSE